MCRASAANTRLSQILGKKDLKTFPNCVKARSESTMHCLVESCIGRYGVTSILGCIWSYTKSQPSNIAGVGVSCRRYSPHYGCFSFPTSRDLQGVPLSLFLPRQEPTSAACTMSQHSRSTMGLTPPSMNSQSPMMGGTSQPKSACSNPRAIPSSPCSS